MIASAPFRAAAQSANEEYVWVIESPTDGATVTETPVLVSALLLGTSGPADLSPETEVLLNNEPVADDVMIDGGRVLVLLRKPLAKGPYTLLVNPVAASGATLPLASWSFEVTPRDMTGTAPPLAVSPERDPVSFIDGTIRASVRTAALSGPGRDTRQEPVRTGQLNASLTASAGEWDVPVSAYWTSDATPGVFRRNRFSIGAERSFGPSGADLAVRVGDGSSTFGTFTSRGVQTRGTYAQASLGSITVRGMYGQTRRAIPTRPIPPDEPPNTIDMITPVIDPLADRRIGVLEVSQSTSRVTWGVRGLRGRDLVSSLDASPFPLPPPNRPGDNTVVEPSLHVDVPGIPVQVEGAAAWSVTTKDRRLDDSSLDVVRDQLNLDVGPAVEWLGALMPINASTTPLDDASSALAWRAAGTVDVSKHTVTLEHQSVGAAFESFGTAFLQTGRQRTMLRGRSQFFRGRLFSRFNLQRETSVGRPASSGFRSNAASGSIRGIVLQRRDGQISASLRGTVDDRTFDTVVLPGTTAGPATPRAVRFHSLSPSIAARWTTGPLQHQLRISASRTVQDASNALGSTQEFVRLSATETFRSVDVGGGWTRVSGSFDTGDALQDARQIYTRIGVTRSPVTAHLQLSHWNTAATRFQPQSQRTDATLRVRWRHPFGAVSVRLGYRDLNAASGTRDYTESFSLLEPTIYL